MSSLAPKYLNALKAGIKTAVFVFVAGLIGMITNISSAIASAATEGNPPDLDFVPGALWTLVAALLVGLLNTGVRFLQAVGIPYLTIVFDKVFGAIPVYVSENTGEGIKEAGHQIIPGPAINDHIVNPED
jgi:flagellar biosynthesis protein FliQ